MSKNNIFRTQETLEGATVGLSKVIIDIPGGLQVQIPNGQRGIYVSKKSTSVPMTFVTYNGRLATLNNGIDYIQNNWPPVVSSDGHGNTIREYSIPDGYSSGTLILYFKVEVGTTRVEVTNTYNYNRAGVIGFGYSDRASFFKSNIEQYAYNGLDPYCSYCGLYGNLRTLKNLGQCNPYGRTIYLSGTDIEGDIANFENFCLYNEVEEISVTYCNKVYGEITPVLEAIKTSGFRNGKNVYFGLYNTKVTYQGQLINQPGGRTFQFDENGNYTLMEINN